MSLTSIPYLLLVFFAVIVYYLVSQRMQPWVLLAVSLFFYSTFDLRYFIFLGFSILTSYFITIQMQREEKKGKKRLWLIAGLLLNLGLLFFIKQYAACASLFSRAMGKLGIPVQLPLFDMIAPVGISFYTLTVAAYCVDAYHGKITAQRNLAKYALYVSFFPCILQGPILRYAPLEDSLFSEKGKKKFDYTQFTFGLQLMLWGFFKKLVIADRVACLVNHIFSNYSEYSGFVLLVGAICYSLQIYTDFSGCVDIVRGTAQTLQIELPHNFRQPYFATSIADFWRRWHMTLSSWLRDYVYIPLGGNRKGTWRKYLNIVIVFFISGLWHGAGLNFMFWGLLHGVYQVLGQMLKTPREWIAKRLGMGSNLPVEQYAMRHRCRKAFQMLITFSLVSFAWIFFRMAGLRGGIEYVRNMFPLDNPWIFSDQTLFQLGLNSSDFIALCVFTLVLVAVDILQRKYCIREKIAQMPMIVRRPIYLTGVVVVVVYGIYGQGYVASDFIYGGF